MNTLDVKEILRSHGLKATSNRISILEYMLASKEHPSAEMISGHLNKLGNSFSIGTVYNILEAFQKVGIIKKVASDENNFNRYDANTDFHVHIFNNETNEVSDYLEDSDLIELKNILERIKEKAHITGNCSIKIEC